MEKIENQARFRDHFNVIKETVTEGDSATHTETGHSSLPGQVHHWFNGWYHSIDSILILKI